jgi:hypothetical protein
MGNLSLIVSFLRARKIRTHAPISFLLEDHDIRGRIGARTWITSISRNSWTFFSIYFFEKMDGHNGAHLEEECPKLK